MTLSDPTAIPINFDPRTQRMFGTAVHGNTPFNVPFITEITPTLWTGGCENGLVLPPKIDHVVSLYPWEQYRLKHKFKSVMAVTLYDDLSDIDDELLFGIATWVNTAQKSGVVLVHCQAGLNRSALVAGLSLILNGMDPQSAIDLLREKRSPAVLCNPSFEEWLLAR